MTRRCRRDRHVQVLSAEAIILDVTDMYGHCRNCEAGHGNLGVQMAIVV